MITPNRFLRELTVYEILVYPILLQKKKLYVNQQKNFTSDNRMNKFVQSPLLWNELRIKTQIWVFFAEKVRNGHVIIGLNDRFLRVPKIIIFSCQNNLENLTIWWNRPVIITTRHLRETKLISNKLKWQHPALVA